MPRNKRRKPKTPRPRQPQKKFWDPGREKMGTPKPLPVGAPVAAADTRQARRQAARAAAKIKCTTCRQPQLLCICPPPAPPQPRPVVAIPPDELTDGYFAAGNS